VHALKKYLSQWAEPETAIASSVEGTYERCLVVPACREEASALDGYVDAAASSSGRTLAIVVVNGMEGSSDEVRRNASFLHDVGERLGGARRIEGRPRAALGAFAPSLDVLLVDRASEGARLPPKTGVGLARKIGADVALALHAAGRVRSPFVYSTDADATLPEGHFARPELQGTTTHVAAAVFPFWHEPGPDEAVNQATALHELSLRYYVRGLSFAGSPYAFHTLGSAMAVHVWAYAAVRGVPKREAGEDFYLLGKVAKVGTVLRTAMPPVRLRSRRSDRTPFGTGAGVARGLESARAFYAPECFVALGRFLGALGAFAEHGAFDRFEAGEGGLTSAEWGAARAVLFDARGRTAFAAAAAPARSAPERLRRVHEWFDAFRTLKFVHALRNSVWPSVEWSAARERASFLPAGPADLEGVRRALLDEEAVAARFGLLEGGADQRFAEGSSRGG
jgi:hypothetical protein